MSGLTLVPVVFLSILWPSVFAQVEMSIYERARLRLIFEAFNLTNRANFSTILRTPGPTYLTPTATFDPRILQLASKFTF